MTPGDALDQVERAFLGSLLLENSLWRQTDLSAEDFGLDAHRIVYRVIAEMLEDGRPVDIVSLTMELAQRGKLAACGDAGYLGSLIEHALPENFSAYQRTIRESSRERRYRGLLESLQNASPGDSLAKLEQMQALLKESDGKDGRGIQVKYLSEIRAKRQSYVWDPYIPSDQLIGLYGPSHTAKSIIAIDWAARITTAAKWPDGSPGIPRPRKVLMLAPGEDAIDTVLKPRFVMAGGDPGRLAYIPSVGRLDAQGDVFEDMASLDRDIPALDEKLSRGDFGLVIIDPVTNHLGSKRPNQEDEVRPVLMRLRAVAEKYGIPILMIGHFNKRDRGTAALDKVLGCRAFVGVPRTIYMTGTDNDTEEKFRYVVVQERGRGAKSWKYKTAQQDAVVDGDNVKEIVLSWEGECDATGQDVVDALSREEKVTERDYAQELTRYLRANGGTMPQDECKKALGFPKVNWTRVRKTAGVESDVQSGGSGKGGRTATWVLASENTSENTNGDSVPPCTNIESLSSVFSGTYPKIQSENTSENTQALYFRKSPAISGKSFVCSDCGAAFDSSVGWAKHSVDGCGRA